MADATCSPGLRSWAGIRARLPQRSSSHGSLVSGLARRERSCGVKSGIHCGSSSSLRKRNPVDSSLLASTCTSGFSRPGMLRQCLLDVAACDGPSDFSRTWQGASRPRTPLVAAGSMTAGGGFSPSNAACRSPSNAAIRSPNPSRPTTAGSRSSSVPASSASGEKRVNFRMRRVSTHSVIPYSEVYGRHPSFFDFTRKGDMAQTDAGIADEMRQQQQ